MKLILQISSVSLTKHVHEEIHWVYITRSSLLIFWTLVFWATKVTSFEVLCFQLIEYPLSLTCFNRTSNFLLKWSRSNPCCNDLQTESEFLYFPSKLCRVCPFFSLSVCDSFQTPFHAMNTHVFLHRTKRPSWLSSLSKAKFSDGALGMLIY